MSETKAAKIASKTNYELVQIIENRDQFKDEIILITIQEMERRGVTHEAITGLKENLVKSQAGKLLESIREQKDKQAEFVNENVPALYSPQTIYFASILINFVFGGILFLMNLFATKSKGKIETSIFILLFLLTEYSFFKDGQIDPVLILLLNGIGGIALNMLFWKRYLGGKVYKKRPAWKPLLIGMAVSLALMYFFGNLIIPAA